MLTDADVRDRLDPRVGVEAARQALVDAHSGTLAAPPRVHAEIGQVVLAFTVGGYPGGTTGFRVYGTWPEGSDQAVLVWNERGRLRGIVVGWELGARRTGALGGAAVAALARPDSTTVAVIGSGRQAWSQLWAISAVLAPTDVRVWSPTPAHRARFAGRARSELELPGRAVPSAREAVDGADVVVLATRSEVPVIEAAWIDDGVHVTTIGPKTAAAHEVPPELADRATVAASDSPEQADAYGEPFFTDRPLVHLGAVLAGETPGRTGADDLTLYCSTGLPGSELVLASTFLDRT